MKPEQRLWLQELSQFIVEANRQTWAADKGAVDPFLPGHKTHRYKRDPKKYPNDPWELVDDYAAYFKAPGLTIVSYKEWPAWQMYYGGIGMVKSQYKLVEPAFEFLREALMKVTPAMPFRGPASYRRGDWLYAFSLKGNLEEAEWVERIAKGGKLVFRQNGRAGIYIHKNSEGKPLYPWEL